MNILIKESLNRNSKNEVYDFLMYESSKIDKSHKLMLEDGFKTYFPELYDQIITDEQLKKYDSFRERMWHFFHNDYSIYCCPVCNNRLKFMSFQKGYRQFCSNECKYKDENYLKKVSENSKELWRTNEKMKITLQKFMEGRDNWWSSLTKEERIKHTEPLHIAMCNAIKNMSDDERKKMYKKNSIQANKTKSLWSQEKKDEIENRKRIAYMQSINNRSEEKKKEISKNVSNGLKNMSDEQKNQKQINIHKSKLKRTQKDNPEVIEIYTIKGNKNTIYTCSCQNLKCDKCKKKIFKTTLSSFTYRKKMGIELCPICHPNTIGTSSGEKDVLKYIKNIYKGTIIENDRNVLSGKEIDIYLPELKIGFEYQGDMWHANPLLFDKSYINPINHKSYTEIHNNDSLKKELANKIGINLIEIWELDWIEHPRTVKKMIKNTINNV